ncbi:MAG: hypothetical protein WCW52_06590 [Elusimicrobiales bacterium]|jgi:hypothetical protein
MKKKLIALFGMTLLTVLPAVYTAAQEMDEAKDIDEAPGWQAGRPGGKLEGKAPMINHGRGMPGEMKGRMERMAGPGAMSEEETLAVIKKHDPAFAEKMAGFKAAAPIKYRMLLMMGGRMLAGARFEGDGNMEADAVKGLSLEFDAKELGLKYEKAAEAEKPAIKDGLRAKVSELFDLRLKGQELRIKKMTEDLARLKKNLENRKINKAKIVDERLGQLTGEGYGW